jgi:uncharacterized protein (TIGR03066 family)
MKNQPKPAPSPGAASPWRRPVLIVLALCVAAGTWLFLEFVLWNRLPSELVGRWEVVDGPREYKEAVFEFQRHGRMIGHVNDREKVGIIDAAIRLDGKKIFATTRQQKTGKEHTSTQTIVTLTETELVIADETGRTMKLRRIP